MTQKKGSAAAPAGEPPEETVTSRDEADEPAGDEDPANEAAGVEGVEEAAKGDDPLAAAQRERDEYLDLARRTQADFENYRKRAAREAAAAGERAKGGLGPRAAARGGQPRARAPLRRRDRGEPRGRAWRSCTPS